MVLSAMLCGIAFFSGCLLTLLFATPFYKRAVRLAKRDLLATAPVNMAEIRADRDHLRAQFAVAIRRLEVNLQELKTKSAAQSAGVGRLHAEISRQKAELENRAALIVALRTRQRAQRAVTRRIVKLLLYLFVRIVKLLYLFVRSDRGRRRALLSSRQAAATIHAAPASVVGRSGANARASMRPAAQLRS
jgi:hypothetical protein